MLEDVVGWSDLPVERVLCAHSTGNGFGVERKTRGQGQEGGIWVYVLISVFFGMVTNSHKTSRVSL